MKKTNKTSFSTPGKLFLMGEHAVVHNKPALYSSIDKRCTVTLEFLDTESVIIESKVIDEPLVTSIDKLVKKTQKVRKQLTQFKDSADTAILKQMTTNELDLVCYAIVEAFAYYRKQLSSGFRLVIESEIPIGSGLGSSAAVIVSTIGALTKALSVPYNPAVINEISYTVEQYRHGNPSGGDNTAVTYGGLVWYRKESPLYKIMGTVPVDIPQEISKHCYLVQSGKPEESTGEMVHKVSQLPKKDLKEFLDSQEEVTRSLLKTFKEKDLKAFKQLIREGESNLEKIGVASKEVKQFIRAVEEKDGAAKICGGGGVKHGCGILFVCIDEKKLKPLVEKYNYSYEEVGLGGEGLREENIES